MTFKVLKNRTIGVAVICVPLIILISLSKPNSLQAIYKAETDRFWAYKVHSKKKFNMLIIGDSRVYRGISPQAINKMIPNIKISNFGFSSGLLNKEIFSEAEKRLDPTAGFKIILIGISPGSLTEYDNTQLHEIMKLTNSEIFDMIYVNFIISKFLMPLKPSEIFSVRNKHDSTIIKEVFYDNGWLASTSNHYDHMKYIDDYMKYWTGNKVSKTRMNDLYERIARWKKEGVYVFAYRAPASQEIDMLEDDLSGFNEKELIDNLEMNGAHWIFLNDKYNRYKSYDGCHLDEQSAVLLSEDLALEMKKVLPKMQ